MKDIFWILMAGLLVLACGCSRKKELSRNEIPAIKQSIIAFENVIKRNDQSLLDSIISREANKTYMNMDSIEAFIEADTVGPFSGFAPKTIAFRDDAARCDSYIQGENGQGRAVTITLKKDKDDLWLIKNLELRSDDLMPPITDSTESIE